LLFIIAAFAENAAAAGGVALLKSKSIPAYDKAQAGFLSAFAGEVSTFDLDGNLENGAQVAAQISRRSPAAVVTIGAKAAQVARSFLPNTPLVYCLVLHPEQFGLRGAGVSGVPLWISAQEQLQALHKLVPKARRIGLLANPRLNRELVHEVRDAARPSGTQIIVTNVESAKQVPQALDGLLPRVDALWLLPDASVLTAESFRFVLLESFRRGVPVIAFAKSFVRAGALLALAPDYEEMGRTAAGLLRDMLAGKHHDGGASKSAAARLTINASTARRLGIRVPPDLAAFAEEFE
jgi:putative ABC transport system substrate-binding protein